MRDSCEHIISSSSFTGCFLSVSNTGYTDIEDKQQKHTNCLNSYSPIVFLTTGVVSVDSPVASPPPVELVDVFSAAVISSCCSCSSGCCCCCSWDLSSSSLLDVVVAVVVLEGDVDDVVLTNERKILYTFTFYCSCCRPASLLSVSLYHQNPGSRSSCSA